MKNCNTVTKRNINFSKKITQTPYLEFEKKNLLRQKVMSLFVKCFKAAFSEFAEL